MSFSKIEPTKFELNNAHTIGVKVNKFGGFTVPIDLDDNFESVLSTYNKVHQLFVDNSVENTLYGTILYLKTKKLSNRNMEELLNKGSQDISINFETTGVYTWNGKRHLIFEVTSLRRLEKPDSPRDD